LAEGTIWSPELLEIMIGADALRDALVTISICPATLFPASSKNCSGAGFFQLLSPPRPLMRLVEGQDADET